MNEYPLLNNSNNQVPNLNSNTKDDMTVIPEEVEKASLHPVKCSECNKKIQDKQQASSIKDILIVVDVQNDFISGSLKAHNANSILPALNDTIKIAESNKWIIVFTKDWHPQDHCSFTTNGGKWPPHCVKDTYGAELSKDLYRPNEYIIVKFGANPEKDGYSPLENSALDALLSSPLIGTVYVAGIALEYCIQSVCQGAKKKGKKVVAIENVIATAGTDPHNIESFWKENLEKEGIIRLKDHTSLCQKK